MAGGSTPPIFYCDVVDYSTGTVVWNAVWVPETSDIAPTQATNGASGYEVNGSGYTTRPKGIYRGTLTLDATLDGTPIGNTIRYIATGNAEWDIATKQGPSVMTQRNHSSDLSLAGI